jgi:hypothetical protein
MNEAIAVPDVLRVADIGETTISAFLARFDLGLIWLSPENSILSSYWGAPEAGIVGCLVHVRDDTPVHSLLHEVCHIICMSEERRARLNRDAGGDDLEEAAVCYLQIVLADYLAGASADRIMSDMDAWGYSFRLGNTARWFVEDADDARQWLVQEGLLTPAGRPEFRIRGR